MCYIIIYLINYNIFSTVELEIICQIWVERRVVLVIATQLCELLTDNTTLCVEIFEKI